MSTIFQQFLTLVVESSGDSNVEGIVSWEVLADELYTEVEANMKFYAIRFDQILDLYYQLLKNYQTQGTNLTICSNIYQIFVVMVEQKPTLIKNNEGRLLSMIQKLFQMFNLVDFQFDQQWIRPNEGYSDQTDFSEETTLTKQIMSYFDRIAMTYTYPKFVTFFTGLLSQLSTQPNLDWKTRYTILMVMSQLGEDIEYPLTIKSFVDWGIMQSQNPHPKVRYGVLQMFGQLSDDMKPHFQEIYGEQILPIVLSLTKDECPRVQAHAMACMTNLFEDFDTQNFHIIQPYIDQILNIAQNFSINGISILKQNTVSALASLSTVENLTNTQVEKILSIINHSLCCQQHKKPEYTQLINQTIECLSMVLYGQDESKINNVLNHSINIIKSLKQRISGTYLVLAWSRLCLKFQNFTELSDIFPFILQQVNIMIEAYQSQVEDAIRSIENSIKSFKGNIKPYAYDIVNMCKNGIGKLEEDGNLKGILYDVLNNLVVTLKNQAPDPQWQEMAKDIFNFLYQQVQNILTVTEEHKDFSELEAALEGFQKCIPNINNLLTPDTVSSFLQKIFNFIIKIDQIIQIVKNEIVQTQNQEQYLEDELDKDDFDIVIKQDKEKLERLFEARLVIPDIFQEVLKCIPKESGKHMIQSFYAHLGGYLQGQQPFENVRFGLYFLCNFLEVLHYDGIQEYANVYEEKFCQFTTCANLEVRNCAVFGLGLFAKLIPIEKTNEALIYKWLNLLWNSLSISFDASNEQESKKKFNFAKDNIVSALGKLIHTKRASYPVALNQDVLKKWLENLPLNHDKTEGNEQHQILLDFLEKSPELIISSKQVVLNLLTIFAKYFSKRMTKTEQIVLKNKKATKSFLEQMKQWPLFIDNSQFLWNSLTQAHRNILTQLMTNN